MKGRKPTPVALKLIAGNPGKRPLNLAQPEPSCAVLVAPDWFPDEAREEWERIVPEMVQLGVFTRVDVALLQGHCLNYAQIAQAGKKGEAIKATWITTLKGTASELGLTPSSRTRLTAKPRQADEPQGKSRFFG